MNSTNEITEIEFLNSMITRLKSLKSSILKKEKLSDIICKTDIYSVTPRKSQKMNNDLNWLCMDIDKTKTDFARCFENSILDVDTAAKEYNPSGFHNYKY